MLSQAGIGPPVVHAETCLGGKLIRRVTEKNEIRCIYPHSALRYEFALSELYTKRNPLSAIRCQLKRLSPRSTVTMFAEKIVPERIL